MSFWIPQDEFQEHKNLSKVLRFTLAKCCPSWPGEDPLFHNWFTLDGVVKPQFMEEGKMLKYTAMALADTSRFKLWSDNTTIWMCCRKNRETLDQEKWQKAMKEWQTSIEDKPVEEKELE